MLLLLQTDTTSTTYKIGYEIGSWLPVMLLLIIFIWLAVRARKRSNVE
jgi:lipopolysaccharide export LptBFGC system permease protein LptF